jgi:hypothetical protein
MRIRCLYIKDQERVRTLYRSWPAVSLEREYNVSWKVSEDGCLPDLEFDGGLVIEGDGLGQERG